MKTFDAFKLFVEGSRVLSRIEENGIRIDLDRLQRTVEGLGKRIDEKKEELESTEVYGKWKDKFGKSMKWDARQQLATVLFDVMGYDPPEERTETGKVKADRSSLEKCKIPFVTDYIKMMELRKVKTVIHAIGKESVQKGKNWYLHPHFNLAGGGGGEGETGGARSFRSSSSDPNFQNLFSRIPEYAEMVRRCFIPRKNRRLVENDFAALEFRIAACVWNDPEMISYARDPSKDIHRDTAADCYALSKKKVSKQVRYCGKNMMVFPIIYGSYYKQCARNLWEAIEHFDLKTEDGTPLRDHLRSKGIEELGPCDPKVESIPGTFEHHVRGVEKRFFDRFRVFAAKKKEWIETYRSKGRFRMVTGFPVAGLYSNNALLNYPIQGPGFHCLLRTLIGQQDVIDSKEWRSLLVGQIHDCSLGDVPDDEVQSYIRSVRDIVAYDLPREWSWIVVPLDIEAEVTPVNGTWWEKKSWVEVDGTWQPKE